MSKKLQSYGVPQKEADAHAAVLGEALMGNFATKTDIETLGKDTKLIIENSSNETKLIIENMRKETAFKIEDIRKDLTIEMDKIKYDMLKWMIIPLMTCQLFAIFGLIKIFI